MESMEAHEREVTVDGAVFRIRTSESGTHYDWISGPNEDYGFASSAGPTTIADDEEAIRHFLSMVDPATGYLDQPLPFDLQVAGPALIHGGQVCGAEIVSQDHPWLPVAVDVSGDLAATLFLVWKREGAWWETATWQRMNSTGRGDRPRWEYRGGGGSGFGDVGVLTHPWSPDDGLHQSSGAGGTLIGDRWLRDWHLRIAPQVRTLRLADRTIRRSEHGHHVLLSTSAQLTVDLLGDHDEHLDTIELVDDAPPTHSVTRTAAL